MKPKILIANKFYYPRGGDCICAINLERMLHSHGHDTAVYAMHYDKNLSTPWDSYFAPQVTMDGGIGSRIKAVRRIMGGGVKASFSRLLDDFKPDVLHLHNIHSYLSPQLAIEAHRRGIAVVWTMHDYKLVCPSYSCLANGHVCRDCLINSTAVLRKRCMKGSAVAGAVAWLEARRWNRHTLTANVDTFVAPSAFMASMLEMGGYPKESIQTLCNFVDTDKLSEADTTHPRAQGDYYCYIGRLSTEKGVKTLLRTASTLPYTLKVAGTGPLEESLRREHGGNSRIEFLGHCDATTVGNLLRGARFSVIPSECYENNPLSLIESLSVGTPVLGADIGGIPELISDYDGMTFPSGDSTALARGIEKMYTTSVDNVAIAQRARERFSPENYYRNMCAIYDHALRRVRSRK